MLPHHCHVWCEPDAHLGSIDSWEWRICSSFDEAFTPLSLGNQGVRTFGYKRDEENTSIVVTSRRGEGGRHVGY